ncbi:DUF6196 family protein [Micromonospora sp. WMMD961]|uniref:DUF6196 family protein n=1 Tax=Micromonospora sp. WMMD961 TaxID=3016100 RepID=UPI002415C957|nr:DUF6196 family protein [Micromonospora sp. WMMD961]MDG4780891.1 DUF6196 family protein [Micromonospora sp. WMMD961]
MVSISQESPDETALRLRQVIAAAELVIFDGEWSFREAPLSQPPALTVDLLAVVRDEDRWCWLAPAGGATDGERFTVFSFHFPPGMDNSGFVGWLATEFKRRLGTGVFVICGHNSDRAGIYDYWGCPAQVRAEAVQVLGELRAGR